MDIDKFEKIIEKAKQDSKDSFLRFATGIYGIDESFFDHLFEVPVLGRYDSDELATTSLSTKSEDELYEIVDQAINRDDMWKDGDVAKYVTLDEIDDLSESEKSEWYNLIRYNAAIIYNNSFFENAMKADSSKLSEKEVFDKYQHILSDTLTHERIHINNAYLDIDLENGTSESLNGAEANLRYDIEDADKYQEYERYWEDNNEVMVETITRMISNYQNGDNLSECLKKLIEERNGKTIYPDIDDKIVLATYVLFTDELTEWMLFGAYDFIRENKLQKKIIDVCGTDMPLDTNQFKINFEKYLTTLENDALSEDQLKMLEMLGFSKKIEITADDMKETATSEKALGSLSGSLLDIKAFMKKTDNREVS